MRWNQEKCTNSVVAAHGVHREIQTSDQWLSTGSKVDCRQATSNISQHILGKADYKLGQTKVFHKDSHELYLEQERD